MNGVANAATTPRTACRARRWQPTGLFFAFSVLTYNLYHVPMRLERMGALATVDRALAAVLDSGKDRSLWLAVSLKISAAMLDTFSAIRERCALVMQEGGNISETS